MIIKNSSPAFSPTHFYPGGWDPRKTVACLGVSICPGESIQLIRIKESFKRFDLFVSRPCHSSPRERKGESKELEERTRDSYLPHGCACLSVPSRTGIPEVEEEDGEDEK